MQSPICGIIREAVRKDNEPLNILTFPTHERYQENLAKTGHNFYLLNGPDIKKWNSTFAPLPENHFLLNSQIPIEVDIDLVLSQNKFGQFEIAKKISNIINVPLINIEHTLPGPGQEIHVKMMRSMVGDVNLFISEYSREKWLFGEEDAEVIHHGIDIDRFYPGNEERENVALSVVNDWVKRDWCCGFKLWQNIVQQDIPTKVIGDTPGLSKPAKDHQELLSAYQKSKIFLNTSTVSPVPTALMEAMACGCVIISTATCMIPEIIQNGENGLISNNPQHLRMFIKEVLSDDNLAKRLGEQARKTIVDKFPLYKFIENWNNTFEKAASRR